MRPSERLEAALGRIEARNAELNAVTALDRAGAARAAAESDARHASGTALGPLDGLIIGVKDNLAVAGLPWTAGLAGLRDRIADRDAEAVTRLRKAGAVVLCTLNMHEGALGATSDNPTFGRVANPLDPARTPGGSSGGSGAAVAAGFVDVALGTDTMGSVRIPAAYCGCLGLKPTDGAVPRDRLAFLSPSLDTVGPIAADLDTLAAAHAALSDPPGLRQPAPPGRPPRIGVPRQIAGIALESEIAQGLARARSALAERAELVELDLGGWEPGRARRGGLLLVEAEGAVALADLLEQPGAVSEPLAALLAYGRDLTSARLCDALDRMRRAREAAHAALGRVDALLLPTAPQLPFPHGSEVPANQADLTALANFSGLPALALPVGSPGPLPASVQLVGRPWAETALFDLARPLLPLAD